MPYDKETSGVAYHEGDKSSRDYCRQQVFIAIRKLKVCNDRMISEYLGWPINRINPWRGELVERGFVKLAYKAPDPDSGRTVSYWTEKPVIASGGAVAVALELF